MKKISNCKKLFFVLFICFNFLNFFSQPIVEWQSRIGGTGEDVGLCAVALSTGGYFAVGSTWSNDVDISGNHSDNYSDCLLIKYDDSGNILWKKLVGGSSNDYAYSVLEAYNGGLIVVGSTWSNDGDITNNNGSSDFLVFKTDSNGNIEWQKSFGGSGIDVAYSLCYSLDSGYVVIGYTSSSDGDVSGFHLEDDVWAIKLDISGNVQWQKCFGGSANERAYSVEQTLDGGYIIGANSNSIDGDLNINNGGDDYWLLKLDSSGNLLWQKSFGGTGEELLRNVKPTLDGGYIISGTSGSNNGDVTGNHGSKDIWVVKTGILGNIEWQKCFGGTESENRFLSACINQTEDTGYIFAGAPQSSDGNVSCNNSNFYEDFWVVKLDNSGSIQWQKCLGGTLEDYPFFIGSSTNNEYLVIGQTNSNDGDVTGNYGNGDFWLVKLFMSTNGISDSSFDTYKILEQIYDLYGNKTLIKTNELQFYKYSDGSIEKKIIIE